MTDNIMQIYKICLISKINLEAVVISTALAGLDVKNKLLERYVLITVLKQRN